MSKNASNNFSGNQVEKKTNGFSMAADVITSGVSHVAQMYKEEPVGTTICVIALLTAFDVYIRSKKGK